MANKSADKRFTKDHEWVLLDGDIATIGITDHAQEQLGDLVHVELPELDRQVAEAETCAVVESVKAASDVYAPLAGIATCAGLVPIMNHEIEPITVARQQP